VSDPIAQLLTFVREGDHRRKAKTMSGMTDVQYHALWVSVLSEGVKMERDADEGWTYLRTQYERDSVIYEAEREVSEQGTTRTLWELPSDDDEDMVLLWTQITTDED